MAGSFGFKLDGIRPWGYCSSCNGRERENVLQVRRYMEKVGDHVSSVNGAVVQLEERLTGSQKVRGSNPLGSSLDSRKLRVGIRKEGI